MFSGEVNLDDNCASNITGTRPGTKVFASAVETSQRNNAVYKNKTPVMATSIVSSAKPNIFIAIVLLFKKRHSPNEQRP